MSEISTSEFGHKGVIEVTHDADPDIEITMSNEDGIALLSLDDAEAMAKHILEVVAKKRAEMLTVEEEGN